MVFANLKVKRVDEHISMYKVFELKRHLGEKRPLNERKKKRGREEMSTGNL